MKSTFDLSCVLLSYLYYYHFCMASLHFRVVFLPLALEAYIVFCFNMVLHLLLHLEWPIRDCIRRSILHYAKSKLSIKFRTRSTNIVPYVISGIACVNRGQCPVR